jgi:hypothetical protein
MLYNMMSNNIITHTYENNLRIRSLLGNGGPGFPPCDKCGDGNDEGGNDDGYDGSLEVVQIIIIIFCAVTFLSCFCLASGIYFDIRDYFYPNAGARAEQVNRTAQVQLERVHCSNTEDDVLQSIVDETDHTEP